MLHSDPPLYGVPSSSMLNGSCSMSVLGGGGGGGGEVGEGIYCTLNDTI